MQVKLLNSREKLNLMSLKFTRKHYPWIFANILCYLNMVQAVLRTAIVCILNARNWSKIMFDGKSAWIKAVTTTKVCRSTSFLNVSQKRNDQVSQKRINAINCNFIYQHAIQLNCLSWIPQSPKVQKYATTTNKRF